MASILIRDLPEDAKQSLRAQAKAHGRSMESEARHILLTAIGKKQSGKRLGALAETFATIGEPLDGWGPMSEADLAVWEGHGQAPDS